MVSADTIVQAREALVHPKSKETLLGAGEVLVGWESIKERLGEGIASLNENDGQALCAKLDVVIYAGEELTADKVNSKAEVVEQGAISRIRDLKIDKIKVIYL